MHKHRSALLGESQGPQHAFPRDSPQEPCRVPGLPQALLPKGFSLLPI